MLWSELAITIQKRDLGIIVKSLLKTSAQFAAVIYFFKS